MNAEKDLNAVCVNERLKECGCPWRVKIVDTIPSTNTALRMAAESGGEEGEVLVALHQSAGKGSAGRSFYSPADTGLYFSVLLRPAFAPSDAGFLTPAAAVAVARALEASSGKPMQIKWVNDVYANGRKLCGILTEAALSPDATAFRYAIVGIGINLLLPEGDFPEELKGIAGAAFDERSFSPGALLADLLVSLWRLYGTLPEHSFMDEYRSRSNLIGKHAVVTAGDVEIGGTVQDVDLEGGLHLLDGEGRLHVLRSGTIRTEEGME
jgi:BirA family biotin operon repressor/biotin-[acetyl-CoA-carboxylase] ligase